MAAVLGVAALVLLLLLWPRESDGPSPAPVAFQRHPAAPARADTELPAYAQTSPELREFYLFAVRRPDVLAYIPCTCGCGSSGHFSNWNCYVRAVAADGTVTFDDMAPT